jgi:hypothetical protein
MVSLGKDPPSPPSRIKPILKGVIPLVLFVPVHVKEIERLGRLFPWKKPGNCPHCAGKLWWHGFVLSYFSCCREAVQLRRLRCSCCGAVHRLRPADYFSRFRSSISEITDAITHRCRFLKWRPDQPRPRQRQWWRSLSRLLLMVLGRSYNGSAGEGFHMLIRHNIIPVTRARQKENRTVR